MRIIFFTRYTRNGASSRLRSYQYLSYLNSLGCECIYFPLHSDTYLRLLYSKKFRGFQAILSYSLRLKTLLSVKKDDIIFIEKELFPYIPSFFEYLLWKCGFKFIVDYDDAIHHNYDKNQSIFIRLLLGNKISKIMRNANYVIVGNKYLYDYAKNNGVSNLIKIPTVVDGNKYFKKSSNNNIVNIGWIGTPATSYFIKPLLPLFESLHKEFNINFTFVGARQEDFNYNFIKCVDWHENSEVEAIQSFDIGIMPLGDSYFEKGKCGYKLIQYMACGIPVVASSIGENIFIVDHAKNGYLASSIRDWNNYLNRLILDKTLRDKLGEEGLLKINALYTISSQGPKLLETLKKVNAHS
jgi:glycosyltransferase involved in cell wall biosynthesis